MDYLYFQLYDKTIMNLCLIDTNGQPEHSQGLILPFYKKADIIALIYDITNRDSFELCENYFKEKIKDNCIKETKIILLGNKNDEEEYRKVSTEEGYKFALENNYIFMETSCKKNENVYEVFENAIIEAHLIQKTEEEKKTPNDKILKFGEKKLNNKNNNCIII